MRKSINLTYLAVIGLFIICLLGIEAILSLFEIQESIVFPIFWMIIFWWILFGKKLLQKKW